MISFILDIIINQIIKILDNKLILLYFSLINLKLVKNIVEINTSI